MSFLQRLFGPPDVEKLKAGEKTWGLIKALKYGKDAEIRHDAARALGGLGQTEAEEPLLAALGDESTAVRAAAAEALGGVTRTASGLPKRGVVVGGPRAVEPLIELLSERDGRLRRSALEALVQIGDERAAGPVGALIHDPDSDVRFWLVSALRENGAQTGIPPLCTALEDTDESVRRQSAKALKELGWEPDKSELGAAYWLASCEVLERRKGIMISTAVDRLVEIGEAAVDTLIRALEHGTERSKAAAAIALGRFGDPRAIDALVPLLRRGGGERDEDYQVRWGAADALVQIYRTGRLTKADKQRLLAIGAARSRKRSWGKHNDHRDKGDTPDCVFIDHEIPHTDYKKHSDTGVSLEFES